MVIRAYYKDRGEGGRNVALIPSSAHGTNPASAALAGMKVVVGRLRRAGEHRRRLPQGSRGKAQGQPRRFDGHVSLDARGLRGKHKGNLLNSSRKRRADIHGRGEHERPGGLDEPGRHRADVCHINLHKTFSIPHGEAGLARDRYAQRPTSRRIFRGIRSSKSEGRNPYRLSPRRHGAAPRYCSSHTPTLKCSAVKA